MRIFSGAMLAATGAVLVAGGASYWMLKDGGPFGRTVHSVDFNRDIRPILNQNCTSCHGGVRQLGNVSFVYREEALGKGKSGRPTIVPGKPAQSELIARVTTTNLEERMPYHAPPLSEQQITLLKQWIKEGADWEDHWAFVPPKPQALPEVMQREWPRQPLDRFVLARLEEEGLAPSPEAGKEELLRRASFDLIGLPPTPDEIASFEADASSDAFEKQVDRLLASPRYGERWATMWLDLARYADNKGYQKNLGRTVWPYRDWVIDAFNDNLPYDDFVIKQLAGDLLPDATFEDHIATTFQRLTPANDEGGTDDEEFRLVAVLDRVATTWSALNGVTMACVQCHAHPYDPIRHVEYYESLAFFNNTRDADLFDDAPVLHVPKDKEKYAEAFSMQREMLELREAIVGSGRQVAQDAAQWSALPIVAGSADEVLGFKKRLLRLQAEARQPLQTQLARFYPQLTEAELKQSYAASLDDAAAQLDRVRQEGVKPQSLKLRDGEAWAEDGTPEVTVYELVAGAREQLLTALRVEIPPRSPEAARHTPEQGFIIDRIDAWLVHPDGKEKKIEFAYFAPDSTETLQMASAPEAALAPAGEDTSIRPPVGAAGGLRLLSHGFRVDSKLFQTRWHVGVFDVPLSIAKGSRIKVHLTQTQTFLQEEKPAPAKRIRLSASADPRWTHLSKDRSLSQKIERLQDLTERLDAIPGVALPVMAERSPYEQRETHLFERGNFLTKVGPALRPDVPRSFPKLPADGPRNRLTMAKWFFHPEQQLTSRVAVNRFWEQLFGVGIVETLEDFGSVGEKPSHPELLDWLALHFQNDLKWDMKALLRELVTSATYRQSGKSTPALLERDPRNRLLAHGPQVRLTAEMVRDQALVASGLLTPTIGGPPVMPPQPAGVWPGLWGEDWVESKGPDRYRRAIYTYLTRSAFYPSFLTFDASARDLSLARRITTNTPLQALVTLNDPAYHEAAEALARRMLAIQASAEHSDLLSTRLNDASRRVLSRDLTDRELAALRRFYQELQAMPDKPDGRTGAQLLHVRSSPGQGELATLTSVAAALLNLDAALTR